MKAVLGSPALALLLRLKLRGLLRRQWRRLRTPKGFLLTAVGCAAFAAWVASLTLASLRPVEPLAGPAGELRVRAFGGLLLLISLGTALTNRGLYLPKNEIERLFSAPVSRPDLVRYRLLAGGLRSLLGGVVLGLFGARRLANPPLAFAGILLAMQVLPVVNQLVAILLGGLERRTARGLRALGTALLATAVLAAGAVALALATDRSLASLPVVGVLLEPPDAAQGSWARQVLAVLTWPLVPWTRMVTAESAAVFAPWFLLCLALHALLGEACARLPIDFRERSLATSARAAARLARVHRGGGVAAMRASREAARWRVPWLFGRGPAGAIAWRKCAGMVRKAKGTFWVALVALAFIVIFASLAWDGPESKRALATPVLIACLGTIYLCSGLRFDFREELERMDIVRSWPLHPARVFLATLLPEVLLVSLLLSGTVVLESALVRGLTAPVVAVAALVPFFVFAWVALDNLVFLFAPVRIVPGQDGLVQNAGRRMIQVALLFALALAAAGCGALAFLGATRLALHLGAAPAVVLACGYGALLAVLAAGNGLLVLLGGLVLRRFDLARDRG